MIRRLIARRQRPLLLLDVDGVLNPLTDHLPDGYVAHPGRWHNFAVHPEQGAWLRDLATAFDLVWATAREDDANFDVGPALGLPALPVIRFTGAWSTEVTWKLPNVITHVGQRAVCWIDDEIRDDAMRWAITRRHPTLLIAADPRTGFTAHDRDDMHAFAREVRAGTWGAVQD